MPLYELLVRTVDKVNPDDPVKNAQLKKRGDVVCTKHAGSWWSELERTSPEWTILTLELSEAELKSLMANEKPPDLTKKYKMLRTRAMFIDLDDGNKIKLKARLREPDELVDPPSIALDSH